MLVALTTPPRATELVLTSMTATESEVAAVTTHVFAVGRHSLSIVHVGGAYSDRVYFQRVCDACPHFFLSCFALLSPTIVAEVECACLSWAA
jgi:hypothetical protein